MRNVRTSLSMRPTKRLGRTVSANDADDPNENADHSGPESEEEQQPWADRIGIRIGPKANGCRYDNEYQRAGTEDQ